MLFLTLGNMNILFAEKKLVQKTYITVAALPTIKKVELVDKKDFTKAISDKNIELFVVDVNFLISK